MRTMIALMLGRGSQLALPCHRLFRAVDRRRARRKTAGDMGSGWGSPVTITQDERQLVVEQPLFSRYDLQPPVRTVYALDGSESRNAVMTGHATQLRVSRAKWDGDALVITTSYPAIDPGDGQAVHDRGDASTDAGRSRRARRSTSRDPARSAASRS